MLAEERHRQMLEAVASRGGLTGAEAEQSLRVSRMTVHRDFDALASRGLVRKVHGGIVALGASHPPDPAAPAELRGRSFAERILVARKAKRAVAQQVSRVVGAAHTLIADASSTVFYLGETLPANPTTGDGGDDRLVVTGGLPLFHALLQRPDGPRAALHGGEPHALTGALVGPMALSALGDMRFDWAIVSCMGVMPGEGVAFISNSEEVVIKQGYFARARRKLLAVDTSKIGQSGPYRMASLDDFDLVVTETGPFTPGQIQKRFPGDVVRPKGATEGVAR